MNLVPVKWFVTQPMQAIMMEKNFDENISVLAVALKPRENIYLLVLSDSTVIDCAN